MSAALQAAFDRSPVGPVVMVTIDLLDGTYIRATWGHLPTLDGYAVASIDSITPVSIEADPDKRSIKFNQLSIHFMDDGFIQGHMAANPLRGKPVTVELGTRAVAYSDWAPHFTGYVAECLPDEDGVELTVNSDLAKLFENDIVGQWVAEHPLQIAAEIMTAAGIPLAMLDTSFDPTDARYASTISHWNTSRGGAPMDFGVDDKTVAKPTKAAALLNGVAELLPGIIVHKEDGLISFVQHNPSATPLDTWTDDDVWDLAYKTYDANLANRIGLEFAGTRDDSISNTVLINDVTSQVAHQTSTSSRYVAARALRTEWVDGPAKLSLATYYGMGINDGLDPEVFVPGTYFYACAGRTYSFSGTRLMRAAALDTQPASAKASTTRLVYLKVEDEIIAVREVTCAFYHTSLTVQYTDPLGDVVSVSAMPGYIRCEIDERGCFGTTISRHPEGCDVYDVTMLVGSAQYLLQRFGYGMPVITLRTNLSKYARDLGDIIKVTSGRLLSTAGRWQIVGKELDLGDEPSIKWTLAYAFSWEAAATPPTIDQDSIVLSPVLIGASSVAQHTAILQDMWDAMIGDYDDFLDDFDGLTGTIGPGGITIGGGLRVDRPSPVPIDLEPLKDNLVTINLATGQIGRRYFDVGTTPDALPNELPLYLLTTDASSVAGKTDLRSITGLRGERLQSASVVGDAIDTDAIGSTHIADGAVIAGKLGESAVVAASIADGAVIADKINTAAINIGHELPGVSSRISFVPNPYLKQRKVSPPT